MGKIFCTWGPFADVGEDSDGLLDSRFSFAQRR